MSLKNPFNGTKLQSLPSSLINPPKVYFNEFKHFFDGQFENFKRELLYEVLLYILPGYIFWPSTIHSKDACSWLVSQSQGVQGATKIDRHYTGCFNKVRVTQ